MFTLPKSLQKKLHCDKYGFTKDNQYIYVERTDPELVKAVEDDDYHGPLQVVQIPENATDWELLEYDGWEEIFAVVDGKIVHITGEDDV